MTTKPKTRKAKMLGVDEKTVRNDPNGAGEAEKLIARWDFLIADGAYKSSIAATEEESNTCFSMHARELDQIAEKLAELIPGSFYDALKLLRFVNSQTEDCEVRDDNLELKIVRNVTLALPDIMLAERHREHDETEAKTIERMRSRVNGIFDYTARELQSSPQ